MDSSTGFCPMHTLTSTTSTHDHRNGDGMNGHNNLQRISATSPTSLNLKASEILARARQAAGQPAEEEDEEPPQIFTDEILNDMQQSLLTLEERIKGGPGSLSMLEVSVLEARLDRIVFEMNDFMINGNEFAMPVKPAAAAAAAAPVEVEAAVPAPVPVPVPAPTTMAFPTPVPVPAPAPAPVPVAMPAPASMMPQGQIPMNFQSQQFQSQQESFPAPAPVYAPAPAPAPAYAAAPAPLYAPDTPAQAPAQQFPSAASASTLNPKWTQNEEEGPAYEGKGGMGLASGTANTWVIDGMDEMTGEEYRRALQESVSARQAARRRNSSNLGNLQSNNYLDSLGR